MKTLRVALASDGGRTDTLVALVENGPLEDGYVPSKSSRDELIAEGLAVRVVVKGQDGYTAATYEGKEAYRKKFGGDTMEEAKKNREVSRKN